MVLLTRSGSSAPFKTSLSYQFICYQLFWPFYGFLFFYTYLKKSLKATASTTRICRDINPIFLNRCFKQAAKKFPQYLETWEYQGQPKIVVKLDNGGEEGLEELAAAAKHRGLPSKIIHDAGKTQIVSGSATVVGVGPGPADLVNEVTGHLKLL